MVRLAEVSPPTSQTGDESVYQGTVNCSTSMLDLFRESGRVSIQAYASEAVYPSRSHHLVSD